MIEVNKICETCKTCDYAEWGPNWSYCENPNRKFRPCHKERTTDGSCGINGKYWTPRLSFWDRVKKWFTSPSGVQG